MIISAEDLLQFTKSILLAMGCPEKDAQIGAEVLVSADLRGIDSHGVARLSGYVRLQEKGRLNPKPEIKVVHETPSTAVLDGDAGLGHGGESTGREPVWPRPRCAPLMRFGPNDFPNARAGTSLVHHTT